LTVDRAGAERDIELSQTKPLSDPRCEERAGSARTFAAETALPPGPSRSEKPTFSCQTAELMVCSLGQSGEGIMARVGERFAGWKWRRNALKGKDQRLKMARHRAASPAEPAVSFRPHLK
jgi:hypothetical protein